MDFAFGPDAWLRSIENANAPRSFSVGAFLRPCPRPSTRVTHAPPLACLRTGGLRDSAFCRRRFYAQSEHNKCPTPAPYDAPGSIYAYSGCHRARGGPLFD